MLAELKKGDDVVTQGGIIGKVTGIKDNELTLQLQEGVRVRFLRSAVTGALHGRDAPAGSPRRSPRRKPPRSTPERSTAQRMERGWWWKAALYGVVTVLAVLYLVPTVVPEEKQPAFIQKHFQKRIQLGLDLQGGLHLVYEVNVDKAVSDKVDRLSSDIEDRLHRTRASTTSTWSAAKGSRRHHPHVQERRPTRRSSTTQLLREYRKSLDLVEPRRRRRRRAAAPRPQPDRRGPRLRAPPGHRDHPQPRRQARRRRADHHQEGDRHHRRAPRPQARRLRADQVDHRPHRAARVQDRRRRLGVHEEGRGGRAQGDRRRRWPTDIDVQPEAWTEKDSASSTRTSTCARRAATRCRSSSPSLTGDLAVPPDHEIGYEEMQARGENGEPDARQATGGPTTSTSARR